MASDPTAADLLELDVDLRLLGVLFHAAEAVTIDRRLTVLLRMAYGTGYVDALREPRRGQLCRDHGLRIPTREVPC